MLSNNMACASSMQTQRLLPIEENDTFHSTITISTDSINAKQMTIFYNSKYD